MYVIKRKDSDVGYKDKALYLYTVVNGDAFKTVKWTTNALMARSFETKEQAAQLITDYIQHVTTEIVVHQYSGAWGFVF